MNLTNTVSNKDLDKRTLEVATQYRRCEAELLKLITHVEERKLYYALGYNSLFSYVHERLGLTKAVTYNLNAVVKKSKEVPELKNKVLAGKLSVSTARKLVSVINKDNQDAWLDAAENKPVQTLEREISMASPKAAILEKMTYVSEAKEKHEAVKVCQKIPRVQLQMGVSEEIMFKLRRAQDLESQKCKTNKGLEETLEAILDVYLEKRDPVKKATRQKLRGKLSEDRQETQKMEAPKPAAKEPQNVSESPKSEGAPQRFFAIDKSPGQARQRNIPTKVRHQVQLRDGGRCTYTDTGPGNRCSSRRYLEVHHIKPYSEGGDHSMENLTLLCAGHHKAWHRMNPL